MGCGMLMLSGSDVVLLDLNVFSRVEYNRSFEKEFCYDRVDGNRAGSLGRGE
jgi:hypothetical protein